MTTETITDKQIRTLSSESLESGDHRMVDICHRAIATDTVDQDGDAIPFADWTRDEARAECARAIDAARAMADE